MLESIEVGEDETVDVGTVLGYIGDGSGAAKAEEPADEPAGKLQPQSPNLQAVAGAVASK